jgi:hypothetical protein
MTRTYTLHPMNVRLGRELRWLLGLFVLPMIVLIGIDLFFSRSPLPLWTRLTSLEDTCSYGICFIAPAILYLAALIVRISIGAVRRRAAR